MGEAHLPRAVGKSMRREGKPPGYHGNHAQQQAEARLNQEPTGRLLPPSHQLRLLQARTLVRGIVPINILYWKSLNNGIDPACRLQWTFSASWHDAIENIPFMQTIQRSSTRFKAEAFRRGVGTFLEGY